MVTANSFTKKYVIYTTIIAVGVPLFFLIEFLVNGSGPVSSGINNTVATEIELPNFDLHTSESKPFTKASFFKKVSLVNFVFSSCPEACPLLMGQTRLVAETLLETNKHLQVVSITVDPNKDKTPVLAEWKADFAPNLVDWKFVGGSKPAIFAIVKGGFKLPVEKSPDTSIGPILHSFKVAIVDHFGKVRGFYDVRNKAQRAVLVKEYNVVSKEAQRIYPIL
jgi:protein SCO1